MVVFASLSQGIRKVKSRSGVCYSFTVNFCDVKIRHKSENPYIHLQNRVVHNSAGNGLVREKQIVKNGVLPSAAITGKLREAFLFWLRNSFGIFLISFANLKNSLQIPWGNLQCSYRLLQYSIATKLHFKFS
jgi:hypothetical protein